MSTFSMAVPRNNEAERETLGACLLSRDALPSAREVIRSADWFYLPAHQHLWAAMCAVDDAGKPVDIITLAEELRAGGRFDECGGSDYLMELTASMPTAANVQYYADIVRDYNERRIVDEACKIGLAAAREQSGQQAMLAVAEHLARIDRTAASARTVHVAQPIAQFMSDVTAEKVEQPLLKTGIVSFDMAVGGLPKTQLIYLSGRAGEGKTTFAQLLARNIAGQYGPTLYVSTEVDVEELCRRFIAMDGRIRGKVLRDGAAQELLEHWQAIEGVHARMREYPLYIMEHFGPTFYDIEAEARRVERLEKRPLSLLVIDRLEHIENGIDDETARMNTNSRGCKRLQLKLKTTVIGLVQPNQDEKRRSDPRPRLTDLAYSGRLRADAQMIIQLYRPSYESRERTDDDEAWVNKNNAGPTGKVNLRFLPEFPAYESRAEL